MCRDCRNYEFSDSGHFLDHSFYVKIGMWNNGERKMCFKCGGFFEPAVIKFHETFCGYCFQRILRMLKNEGTTYEKFIASYARNTALTNKMLKILEDDESFEDC